MIIGRQIGASLPTFPSALFIRLIRAYRMKTLLLSLSLLLLVAQSATAGTVTYVYTDPQGTPLAEADASGNITARFDYAPYGAASTASGMSGAPNGLGYTGHVNDPESGFVYMQARYYDPAVGRFLSVDPVVPEAGNTANFTRYVYAGNNPILNIDPDGRQQYGYGTNQPARILDCHQTNSCKTLAEAQAIFKRDGKTLVLVQGGIAATAAVTAVTVAAAPVVVEQVRDAKPGVKAFCAIVPILCNPQSVNTFNPNFDATDPPENGEVEMVKQLQELEEWIEEMLKEKNTPTQRPTPPPKGAFGMPLPPSPSPSVPPLIQMPDSKVRDREVSQIRSIDTPVFSFTPSKCYA